MVRNNNVIIMNKDDNAPSGNPLSGIVFFLVIIAIVVCIIAIICSCGKVDTGEAGMLVRFGEIISKEPLPEGLHFYMPFVTNLVKYDCKNQVYETKTEAFTKDIQAINLSVAVTYNLDRLSVIELHQKTGQYYREKLIAPDVPALVKDVIGKWEADQIIPKREEATSLIYDALAKNLKKYGINILRVNLINIDFADKFEAAVEEKQVAMQNAIKAKNETVRIQEEAKQKVIVAEAEAKAMEVRAKALETNKSLVTYEAVMRWDGHLPQTMLESAFPILNVNDLKPKKQEREW